jgi:hypothetical protein
VLKVRRAMAQFQAVAAVAAERLLLAAQAHAVKSM